MDFSAVFGADTLYSSNTTLKDTQQNALGCYLYDIPSDRSAVYGKIEENSWIYHFILFIVVVVRDRSVCSLLPSNQYLIRAGDRIQPDWTAHSIPRACRV